MRHNIQSTGNCSPMDETEILCISGQETNIRSSSDSICFIEAEKHNLIDRDPVQSDHDYADISNLTFISEYKEAAIEYITGYVVRMSRKKYIVMFAKKHYYHLLTK